MPRVKVGLGIDAGFQIEIVPIQLPAQRCALSAQHLETPPDRVQHRSVLVQRVVYPLLRASGGGQQADGGAWLAVSLDAVVPFEVADVFRSVGGHAGTVFRPRFGRVVGQQHFLRSTRCRDESCLLEFGE